MKRIALLALAACLGLGGAAADDSEPPYDLEREEFKCESPPFLLERPSDSWVFLKLDVLQERARAEGQDPSGFETLKAQLWWGAAKASIYVRAFPDGVHRREPPTSDLFADGQLEHLQRALSEAELKKRGPAKVGKRLATILEVEGKNAAGDPWLVQEAVVYRPEDLTVFVISLEGPAGERTKDLRKQFKKLLKKVRL
ncbi:MAG: hypothetical protein KDD82_18025 [Planctomycetes bacterium]|nr:hypothetical protein [Planctomycetota bacterium]